MRNSILLVAPCVVLISALLLFNTVIAETFPDMDDDPVLESSILDRYGISSPTEGSDNEGKLAFGYFSINKSNDLKDVQRYSYQFQSYLADIGAFPMLYLDELEYLVKQHGGKIKCGNKKSAIKIGRSLGVSYMGYGSIRKFLNIYTIKVGIVDVTHGTVILSKKRSCRGKEAVFCNETIPQLAFKIGEALERKGIRKRNTLFSEDVISQLSIDK